jgi:peptidoglycan/LPS O-acetylase OafA/YrhL
LWVVLYHLDVTIYNRQAPILDVPGFRIGWLGVDLFYVLSAYLLGQPFLDGRARPYRKFLGDRFLRVAPAYYASIVLAVAFVLWLLPDNFHPQWAWLSLVFLSNSHVDAYYAVNPALWSLAVEMQFYLVLPFLARLFVGRRWPIGLALCVGVALVFRAATYRWEDLGAPVVTPFDALFLGTFSMPAFLAHFGLGLAACRLRSVAHPWPAAVAAVPLILVPVLVWIPAGSVIFGFESLAGQVLVRPLAASGFALLILAAASPGGLRRLLGTGPLRWLGDISYSLYLAHIPVHFAIDRWLDAGVDPWRFAAFAGVASIAAGAALYYAVERPAERWRHQRKLRTRTAAAAPSRSAPPS